MIILSRHSRIIFMVLVKELSKGALVEQSILKAEKEKKIKDRQNLGKSQRKRIAEDTKGLCRHKGTRGKKTVNELRQGLILTIKRSHKMTLREKGKN